MNENKRGFTWRRLNPNRKQSRLDYFLISSSLANFATNSSIVPGYRSDHSGISLTLQFSKNDRGKGYWKFNNSLLKDENYISLFKTVLNNLVNLHKINQNVNNDSYENIILDINDQLFLETFLVTLRGETIKFSSHKKKMEQLEENKLEKEIITLENNISKNLETVHESILEELHKKKTDLYTLRKKVIEGVMLRSKCRYENLGEKPTKYFLQLEKRNFTNKTITKLIDENNTEYTHTKDILNYQMSYYAKLFQTDLEVSEEPIDNIIGANENALSEIECNSLEGEITLDELKEALNNMKNDKSPGLDGYTAEFFKFFWVHLSHFILKSLNYAYRNGCLSVTQTQGVITCLPKPNKNRMFFKKLETDFFVKRDL
jgi:hypothetical protein